MKNIVFDLETVPSQLPGIRAEFVAAVTAPGQYKKPDSIAEWLSENREAEGEKAWLQTSFDGGLGQICVIGYAIDDGPTYAYAVDDLSRESERNVIQDFFCAITDAGCVLKFIGHNVIGFDLRFLWQRAMVLGIRPPWPLPRDPKPWSESVADTMLMWNKDQRAGGSMDRLCRIFGIPGKGDISGADVWPMVRDGRIAEVAEYCKGDVWRTRELYLRMTFDESVRGPFSARPTE